MNIFLTGASGFVGSAFLKYVKNKKVFIFTLGLSKIKGHNIKNCRGRLNNKFNKEFSKCSTILHLASAGVNNKNTSYKKLYKINVSDSLKLFKNAAENNCLNWVVAGSSSEYGITSLKKKKLNKEDLAIPISNYAKTKYIFTKKIILLAKKKKAKLRIMRLFPLYGQFEKKHRLYSTAVNLSKKNKDIILYNGNEVRDYLDVRIAVKILYQSLNFQIKKPRKTFYQIWHVASGKSSTIKSFVKKVYKKFLSKGKIILKNRDNKLEDNFHHCSDIKSIWCCVKNKNHIRIIN